MKHKWILAVALILSIGCPAAYAQSPQVKEITFQSEGQTVHGRFFSAGSDPFSTLLLLPGGDFNFTDVLELGRLLSAGDVNVVTFAARGTRGSEGQFTFANAVNDVAAALLWLRGPGGRAFNVFPNRIAVGGYSLGGGIAMAFAARDSTMTPIVSIAGNDLGEFARRLRSDSTLVTGLLARLSRLGSLEGFAIGKPAAVIQQILDNEATFGHTENAVSLAHRSILLLAGWDDATAPLETVVLPFYRALKQQPGSDVTIIAYADGHAFRDSRQEMASDIRAWLGRQFPGKPR